MFAPAFTPPPPNPALTDRIVKFAQFSVNNAQFDAFVRQKEAMNPEYAFLRGGEGAPFFAWVLHCTRFNQPWDRPPIHPHPHPHPHAHPQPPLQLQQHQHQPPPPSYNPAPPHVAPQPPQQHSNWGPPRPAPPQPLPLQPPPPNKLGAVLCVSDPFPPPGYPEEVRAPFAQVLAALSGDRQQIEASQAWFMQCRAFAPGMAQQILERIRESGLSLERQMHLFFLVNDVLFRALAERPAPGTPEDADPVALAFRPHLGLMAQSIFSRPDATDADRQQLRKMLSFWGEQGIFSLRTLGDVDEVMRTPRGHVPPSLRARAMPPPPQPAMSPQQVQPIPQPSTGVNWGPPVASAPRPSGGNWGPPAGLPSAAAAPPHGMPPPSTYAPASMMAPGPGAVPMPPATAPPPALGLAPRPPPGPPPPAFPHTAHPPPFGMPWPSGYNYGYGGHPGFDHDASGNFSMHGGFPSREEAPAIEAPPQEPKDPFAIPTAAIPLLVRDKIKAYVAYTTLTQEDVDEGLAQLQLQSDRTRTPDETAAAAGGPADEKENMETVTAGARAKDPVLAAKVARLFAEYAAFGQGFADNIEAVRAAVLRGEPLPGTTKSLAAVRTEEAARRGEDAFFPRSRERERERADRDRGGPSNSNLGGGSVGFHAGLGARQAAEEQERTERERAMAMAAKRAQQSSSTMHGEAGGPGGEAQAGPANDAAAGATGAEDLFALYRKQKSQRYFENMK